MEQRKERQAEAYEAQVGFFILSKQKLAAGTKSAFIFNDRINRI